MTYDTKCHDLALAFLRDYEPLSEDRLKALAHELAQEIQGAIEAFMLDHFDKTGL